jgi:hypothetical protein
MDAVVGGPAQATELRGRASVCAALDEVIADARGGESRTLVVRGEAGCALRRVSQQPLA